MLSVIWTVMIASSVLWGTARGQGSAVAAAGMEGAAEAVSLCLGLAGSLCLWSAVTALMEESGLSDLLGRLLAPALGRLFPDSWKRRSLRESITANVTANLLGLGNAATPMGIAACQAMGDGSGTATDEQCRLVVMNTASIQLLPTTVAAVRAGLGCGRPLDILPAVLLTSLCSVTAGLLACRALQGGNRHG